MPIFPAYFSYSTYFENGQRVRRTSKKLKTNSKAHLKGKEEYSNEKPIITTNEPQKSNMRCL